MDVPTMSAGMGGVFLLVFALAIGGSLLLYLLVQQEHERRPTMERDSAEQAARKDRRDEEQ